MKLEYDRDADAAFIYFQDDIPAGGVARTISVDPQAIGGMVNLDLDDLGRIVGLEVLDASKLLPRELLEGTFE
jgi:uncharacterized protein YuzE